MTGKPTSTHKISAGAGASVRSLALGKIPDILDALNSPRTNERKQALAEAARRFETGEVGRPMETGWTNPIARTFFSYSVAGFSPSRLTWEAVVRGLSVIGSADLDNLGAMNEMFAAGEALHIRTTVSLETTVLVDSYADRDINRVGFPGVMRAMGVGFSSVPGTGAEHGKLIATLPQRAVARNVALIEKINALLTPVKIDFESDVLPLTPAGNATEKHISAAYARKAMTIFTDSVDLAVFWADVLGRSPADVGELLADQDVFLDSLAEKIMPTVAGQSPAGERDHPSAEAFFQAVRASGAIPCLCWQGGDTDGEKDAEQLLSDAEGWGARAVAVTPDGSWNLSDPEKKAQGLKALEELMVAARKRRMPILAGSRMNRPGQKFVDSFDAPEVAPYVREFTDSAYWLYGHTLLARALGYGVGSPWARLRLGRDRGRTNAFYLEVGKTARPGSSLRRVLSGEGADSTPEEILNLLRPA